MHDGFGWFSSLQIITWLQMISGMSTSPMPLPTALGRPALRALEAAGFRTLGDLEGSSERVLLDLHGVGPHVIKVLREHGVDLRS